MPGVVLDLLLQIFRELLVALVAITVKRVDLKAAQTLAVLVDAQSQPAANRLSPFAFSPMSRRVQIWKTLGLSQPSCNAEWEKINLSGVSKDSSFSFSFMIRL